MEFTSQNKTSLFVSNTELNLRYIRLVVLEFANLILKGGEVS